MQLTHPLLLLTTVLLTSAHPASHTHEVQAGTPISPFPCSPHHSTNPTPATPHLERRGGGASGFFKMKETCKDMLKSDKAPYMAACPGTGEDDDDARNMCLLEGVLRDASPECKLATLKAIGFEFKKKKKGGDGA